MTQRITALILTFNEQKHIGRCLRSLQGIADQIIVVDSGSTDRTTELCNEMGAEVLHHTWHNYSTQFNWGLDNAEIRGDWVLRIDADEYLNEPLREALKDRVLGGRVGAEVGGLYLHRVMVFMGRPIRWGGCGDLHMLRLFRRDIGRCEERWMDEHISISSGRTEALPGELMRSPVHMHGDSSCGD